MTFKRKITEQVQKLETSLEGQESPLAVALFKSIDAELDRLAKAEKSTKSKK